MKILITAGPTIEPIDSVRYLSNYSSGKMGYCLAEAFRKNHSVLLISGKTNLLIPEGVEFFSVTTCQEMEEVVKKHIGEVDIAIHTAAVSDYRVAEYRKGKIKKKEGRMSLDLVKNPDILKSCREQWGFKGTLVGFAAESEGLVENGRKKLKEKQCDLVIANDIGREEIGFQSDENEVILLFPDSEEKISRRKKTELAELLLSKIICLHEKKF